jgi:hypothetical protein
MSFARPRREARAISIATSRPSLRRPPAPPTMTASRGHPKQGPSGPVSPESDAGPPPATRAGTSLTVWLTCEACDEELLVAFPRAKARYAAVDCPSCGCSYLVLLAPGDGGEPQSTTSAG